MHLYSAHDSTVAPLLAALQVYDGRWPDFGAHVVLELLESTGDGAPGTTSSAEEHGAPAHYVRVLFNHVPVELPACAAAAAAVQPDGTLCPYERFREVLARFIPADHRRECQRPST